MIYTFIAYDITGAKDLGATYNKYMELLDEEDWAVFLDHDAMFTTTDWMEVIKTAINDNPEYGVFTSIANRIGSPWQRATGVDPESHDISYHRQVGAAHRDNAPGIIDVTDASYLSGVLMVVKKSAWKQIGGAPSGMLGVDGQIHIRCRKHNIKVGFIPKLYVYHWYRGDGNHDHLN